MENKKEIQSDKIVLREGLEISPKISVLSWDKISLLYNQFVQGQIGEMVLTFEIIKILLIDKSKIKEIDDILNGELTDDLIVELWEWGEKIMGLVMWFIDAKKK